MSSYQGAKIQKIKCIFSNKKLRKERTSSSEMSKDCAFLYKYFKRKPAGISYKKNNCIK